MNLRQLFADLGAQLALNHESVERLLLAGTRRPALRRRLRLGAIALGYTRVLRERTLRIAELEGYRFWVNVAEPLGVEPYFFGRPGTAWLTPLLLRPGDVCVDAGANAGHYTFMCAHAVSSTGRVVALEPDPYFADLLQQSIVLNGYEDRVVVKHLALAAEARPAVAFHVSKAASNTGLSSLVDHGWFSEGFHVIEVSTTTLDEVLADTKYDRFRLVKIDVERSEDAVLAGSKRLLAGQLVDYFIIELRRATSAEELLTTAGYEGFLLDEAARRLIPLKEVANGHFGDYLFRRPGLPLPL
jgi:FkbM family methyltransferase